MVTTPRPVSLNRRWLIWGITTLLMILYVGAARIESHPVGGKLKLTPGTEIELSLFRLFDNPLRMGLDFKREGCRDRPELGTWQGPPDRDGLLKLVPGANVRIAASTEGQQPIVFDAMPMSAHNCESLWRDLTTNLAVGPGLYRWPPPPDMPELALHRGFNRVHLKVLQVDPPIIDETVELYALAALGFKNVRPNVFWLWYAFFLETIFEVTQSVWLLLLLWWTWSSWRKRQLRA